MNKAMEHELRLCKVNPIFLAILLSFLIAPALGIVSDVPDLLVDHTLSSPEIWTMESGQKPASSTVVVKISQQESSQPRMPIDVVLALDSSGSMSQSDRGNIRIDAARKLASMMNPAIDKIGVVIWNDTIVLSQPLTDDFGKIDNQLAMASIPFGGTCMGEALNTSIALLSQDTRDASKVIIFLSDGREESCSITETPCGSGLAAKRSGILIYTIGLGSSADEDALKCISSATGAGYYYAQDSEALVPIFSGISQKISNITAKDVVLRYSMPSQLQIVPRSATIDPHVSIDEGNTVLTWNIGAMEKNQPWQVSFGISSNDPGMFSLGVGPNSAAIYTGQNGTAGNAVIPTKELLVKSPGAFPLSGHGSGGSITDPLTNVMVTKEVVSRKDGTCPAVNLTVAMPDTPYNIDLVFALDSSGSMWQSYAPGTDKLQATWMTSEVESALKSNSLFRNVRVAVVSWDDKPEFVTDFYPGREWSKLPPLTFNETNTTIYAPGLKAAVKVLDDHPTLDPYNTRRIIVFVTGLSEFNPGAGLDAVIQDAQKKNYRIYPVGIDINKDDMRSKYEYSILKKMADETGGKAEFDIQSIQQLEGVIRDIYADLAAQPVARDVVVTDTLYPYLKIAGTSEPSTTTVLPQNPDGTTTLEWRIGDMLRGAGGVKRITINTALQLDKLPVDVTGNKNEVSYRVDSTTPASEVAYTWFTGEKKSIEIPEGELSISCGAPCPVCPAVAPSQPIEPNRTEEKMSAIKPQPGFEALLSMIGLFAVGSYVRRKK